jgi:hypothetical protein
MFYGMSELNRCVLFIWISGVKELKSDGHFDYLAWSTGRGHSDIFSNFIVHWNPLCAQATVTFSVNKHTAYPRQRGNNSMGL